MRITEEWTERIVRKPGDPLSKSGDWIERYGSRVLVVDASEALVPDDRDRRFFGEFEPEDRVQALRLRLED